MDELERVSEHEIVNGILRKTLVLLVEGKMKKVYRALLFGLFISILSVNAQNPSRTPTRAEETLRVMRERQTANQESGRLENIIRDAESPLDSSQRRWMVFERSIEPLYRKPTKEELKAISPNVEDTQKYAEFLRQSDTGLIKLAVDAGCSENTKIVVATPECSKYTMPGAGSSYSFRTENYRLRRLADILYTENSFQLAGVLLHGIFVKIGDVPLEKVDLQTKGLKFLVDFQPDTDYDKLGEFDKRFSEGVFTDGFQYRRSLWAVQNTTYILRSIAYNGVSPRNAEGISYNEFEFDKRKDIIVAFRVIRKDSDGSITILWKKLSEKKPPKRASPKQTRE
jgi:hypothetical protein